MTPLWYPEYCARAKCLVNIFVRLSGKIKGH